MSERLYRRKDGLEKRLKPEIVSMLTEWYHNGIIYPNGGFFEVGELKGDAKETVKAAKETVKAATDEQIERYNELKERENLGPRLKKELAALEELM